MRQQVKCLHRLESPALLISCSADTLYSSFIFKNQECCFSEENIKKNAEIISDFSVLVRVTGFEPAAS